MWEQLLYAALNFLILLGIVFLMFGKTVLKIFVSHRRKINDDLDKAERLEGEVSLPCAPEPESVAGSTVRDERLALLNKQYEFEDGIRRDELKQQLDGLRVDMLERTRTQSLSIIYDEAAKMMRSEPFASEFRKKEHKIAEDILLMIKLTPGDLSYMVKHDVLYVTLVSAYPLEQEIIDSIDWATEQLLKEVGGKKSFWVRVDESLIGGITLRIGDTIYDGSLADVLYNYRSELSRTALSSKTTGSELISDMTKAVTGIKQAIDVYQLGRVIKISDGICWLDGLADIMYGEVVEFDCGERGMILDIQSDKIGCIVFGKYENIESGNRVRRLGHMAGVPVGDILLGRVVDALGNPLDGLGKIWTKEYRPIENPAPVIPDRAPVCKPLHTGLRAIDALVPIGKGQRELIIGDRQTGKSAIVIDTILNQRDKNVICIYVAIGQKDIYVADLYSKLKKYGALSYTVIVSADAFSSASMQYIAPFAATSMGEHFMYSGKDVLVIYDDLSKHAVAYRELSLLLQRPSGREAYPGDVFYLHARLLERSAHLSDERGGGSMTALPVIETQAGDISAYIPTNTISITDGQIFLESELFNKGQRPAINVGLSVSRVGSAAQTKLMKQVSAHLRTDLAQYRELETFSQFGADLDDNTKKVLAKGERMMAVLRQKRYSPLPDEEQALAIFAVSEGFADCISTVNLEAYIDSLVMYMRAEHSDIMDIMSTGAKMSDEFKVKLKEAIAAFGYTEND